MEGISPFQSGRPLLSEVTADKLNRILAEIKRNRPVVSAPLSARVTGDGTHISMPRPEPGADAVIEHPFRIISRGSPNNESQYLVSVHPGTINTLLPTGIFGSGGNLQTNTIPKETLRYVVLEATSDGQQITAAAISVAATAPTPQEPVVFGLPTTAKFLIGIVYSGKVFQVQFTNFTLTGKQQFIASKSSPAAAGELPYEIYYVWG
jgi:hypothetical protein